MNKIIEEWQESIEEKSARSGGEKSADGKKKYSHFDSPISVKDKKVIEAIKKPQRNTFFPFILKANRQRKFRKESKDEISTKVRNIMYASHKDAHIFSFFNFLLLREYEKSLASNDLQKEVIAYRTISKSSKKGGKCNIDFAKEVFDFISRQDECVVFIFDITGFFDNLNHKILKQMWNKVLSSKMSDEYHSLFRKITRYSYVNFFDIDKKERAKPVFFKDKKKFKENIPKIVKKNKYQKGIPQGTPISGTLANIYLLDFDRSVKKKIGKDSLYRRYSDDLVIVCKKGEADQILKFLIQRLEEVKLEIQPEKGQKVLFQKTSGGVGLSNFVDNSQKVGFLQYLGFEFDGQETKIRSSTMSKRARKLTWKMKPREKRKRKNTKIIVKPKQKRISYFIQSAKQFSSKKIQKQNSRMLQFIGKLRKKYR